MSGSQSPSTRSPSPLVIDEQQASETNASRCNPFSIDYILSNAVKQQQQQQQQQHQQQPKQQQQEQPVPPTPNQPGQANQFVDQQTLAEHLELTQMDQQRDELMAHLRRISNAPHPNTLSPPTANSMPPLMQQQQRRPDLTPPGQIEPVQRLLAESATCNESLLAQPTNNPNFFYFMACMLLQQQQQSNLACHQAKLAAVQQQHRQQLQQQQQQQQQRQQQQQQQQQHIQADQPSPMDSLALLARLTSSAPGPAGPSGSLMNGGGSKLGPLNSAAHRSLPTAPTQRRAPYPLPTAHLQSVPLPNQPPPPPPQQQQQHHQHLINQQYLLSHHHTPLAHLGQAFDGMQRFPAPPAPPPPQRLSKHQHQLQERGPLSKKLFGVSCKQQQQATPVAKSSGYFINHQNPNGQTRPASNNGQMRQQGQTVAATNTPGDKLDSLKPAHSYIGLIGMCILSQPDKRMVLNDIYQYILDHYPYYRNRGSGWRNSVRHNLSLNECFQKAGRAANGKGHYWTIHPANMEDFMNGDFRRRRAQRKVRRWNNMDVPSDESDDESVEDSTRPPLPEHFKRSIEMHKQLEADSLALLAARQAQREPSLLLAGSGAAGKQQELMARASAVAAITAAAAAAANATNHHHHQPQAKRQQADGNEVTHQAKATPPTPLFGGNH